MEHDTRTTTLGTIPPYVQSAGTYKQVHTIKARTARTKQVPPGMTCTSSDLARKSRQIIFPNPIPFSNSGNSRPTEIWIALQLTWNLLDRNVQGSALASPLRFVAEVPLPASSLLPRRIILPSAPTFVCEAREGGAEERRGQALTSATPSTNDQDSRSRRSTPRSDASQSSTAIEAKLSSSRRVYRLAFLRMRIKTCGIL